MKRKIISMVAIFAVSATLVACGSSSDVPDAGTVATPSGGEEIMAEATPEEKESGIGFADNVCVTEDYTIEITDYRIIAPGDEGNEYGEKPVIAFWYSVTNTSGEEVDPMSAWAFTFTAIQDNDPNAVNELETGPLPDDQFLDSQMETIKSGGTVENAWAYELDDEETPVTLIAVDGLIGEKLGEQTFTITDTE